MATEKNDPRSEPSDEVMQQVWQTLDNAIDEVDRITHSGPHDEIADKAWQLLDDVISEEDRRQLIETLEKDEEARRVYVECVQLHVGLMEHFGQGEVPKFTPPSTSAPPLDVDFPTDGGRSVK